jgi:hypothetical protein
MSEPEKATAVPQLTEDPVVQEIPTEQKPAGEAENGAAGEDDPVINSNDRNQPRFAC